MDSRAIFRMDRFQVIIREYLMVLAKVLVPTIGIANQLQHPGLGPCL